MTGEYFADLAIQRHVQIGPIRVHLLDQSNLPIAVPFLEALLPRNRLVDPFISFVPDKSGYVIAGGEARNDLGSVLTHAARKIVGHAQVEGAMATACEEIDIVGHWQDLDLPRGYNVPRP